MRYLVVMALFILGSCNDDDTTPVQAGPKTLADSLELEIDKAHITGMGKMGQLTRYQQYTSRLRDSISALPNAARAGLTTYKNQLDSLQLSLDYAEKAMDKWMSEFKADSLKENENSHQSYMITEKTKVDKMLEAMLTSIRTADSLLPIGQKNKK